MQSEPIHAVLLPRPLVVVFLASYSLNSFLSVFSWRFFLFFSFFSCVFFSLLTLSSVFFFLTPLGQHPWWQFFWYQTSWNQCGVIFAATWWLRNFFFFFGSPAICPVCVGDHLLVSSTPGITMWPQSCTSLGWRIEGRLQMYDSTVTGLGYVQLDSSVATLKTSIRFHQPSTSRKSVQ